jgi:hypothetical protein
MNITQKLLRLGLATALLGSLGACAVAPYPVGYHRPPPAYVETYPGYGQPSGTIYYNSGYRHYDDRGGRYYDDRGGRQYDDRRYEEPRRQAAPLPPPMQIHRDVRRSLGLPRLPGMP